MKHFIITVDTEGDNLWRYKEGEEIETHNAKYLPRFQSICEKYGLKPVYLTNYEMAKSETFVNEANKWLSKGTCEIGVHLHAWNTPPIVNLQGPYNGKPYLIEYPYDVMRAKFQVLYDLLVENFGIKPVSHRAGRWAMDDRYFKILREFGIKVDCSYTPGISWKRHKGITIGGSDYSIESKSVQMIDGVMEVPATTRFYKSCLNGSWKHRIKTLMKGEHVWLRPAMSSLAGMKRVLDIVDRESDVDLVEFMLHSSELMPGGSPYFPTREDIEKEYKTIETFFAYAKSKGYQGCTLEEYYNNKNRE